MEKVLIIEDSLMNREMLHNILKGAYEVFMAEDGETGLTMARNLLPTIIILDIVLPKISGFQVLDQLKNDFLTRDIPVIFITGLTDTKSEEKGLICGAVDYITKPFHPGIVLARIHTHVKLVNYRKTIEALTMQDSLTCVYNRRAYDIHTKVEWARASREKTPLSVFIIDIDNFKQYNDTYGHAGGDEVLRKVAQGADCVIKQSAGFFARYGGEEFAAILPNTTMEEGIKLAEKTRTAIEDMNIVHKASAYSRVTVSIGGATTVAVFSDAYQDFFGMADSMLYEAKSQGRNRVLWKTVRQRAAGL